jgi:anti-sigma regulatory factor (Ser/Thr protein kinase)
MSHRLDCEPVPSSVRTARLFVVDKLQEWRCDELVDRVALLTSELATNAVVHTGQPYSVSVARHGPSVRVEVVDQADRLPSRRDLLVDLTEDGGDMPRDAESAFSGLGIVDATATAWGSEHVPGGKVVWFELGDRDGPDDVGARSHGLRDLREMSGTSPLADDLDRPVDAWLVALDRPRLPLWARALVGLLLVVVILMVALVLRG